MATTIDKLVTLVSMQGVAQTISQQRQLGMGFRGLGGDIEGAAGSMRNLGAARMALGAAMVGIGVGTLRYMYGAASAAADVIDKVDDLGRAFQRAGTGGAASAELINNSLSKLPKVVPEFRRSMLEAAQALATAGAAPAEIEKALPGILDTTVGLHRMGKEATVQGVAMAAYRALTTQQTRGLTALGLKVDAAALKTQGLGAITKATARFHGDAADELRDQSGALIAAANNAEEARQALGVSLAPAVVLIANKFAGAAMSAAKFNTELKGVPGIAIAAGAVLTTIVGVGIIVRAARDVHILALACEHLSAAATLATGATTGTAATGVGAGAVGAGAAAGVFGRVRGLLGRVGKAGAIGAALYLGGAALESLLAKPAAGELEKKWTRGAATRFSLGTVGAGALQGAGLGAGVGTLIAPGVGTLPGGAIGAAIGGIGAMVRGIGQFKDIERARLTRKPVVTLEESVKRALDEIAGNTRTMAQLGGGPRSARAVSERDMRRMLYGTMARSVV